MYCITNICGPFEEQPDQGRYFLLALCIVRKYPFLFHQNDTRIKRRFRKMEPCLLLDGDVVLSLVCGPHYGWRGKSRFSFYFPIMTFAFVLLLGYIFFLRWQPGTLTWASYEKFESGCFRWLDYFPPKKFHFYISYCTSRSKSPAVLMYVSSK